MSIPEIVCIVCMGVCIMLGLITAKVCDLHCKWVMLHMEQNRSDLWTYTERTGDEAEDDDGN